MLIPRIIPCLLLDGRGLYKGECFRKHKYIGDPINAVHIFNRMEADELLFLDISATHENRIPPLDLIQDIADECFMPFAVGGGIRSVAQASQLFRIGVEKVCLNTGSYEVPGLVTGIANEYGNQSLIVSIDIRTKTFRKNSVFVRCGRCSTGIEPVEYARMMENYGAGELLITDISREGTRTGYNLEIIAAIKDAVSIPVIASGGAASLADFQAVLNSNAADAAAAGCMFVMHGTRKAVLISYPERIELENLFRPDEAGGSVD